MLAALRADTLLATLCPGTCPGTAQALRAAVLVLLLTVERRPWSRACDSTPCPTLPASAVASAGLGRGHQLLASTGLAFAGRWAVQASAGASRPVPPCRQVHDYLRSKLCSLYENDCIFDKFECVWNGSDR